MDRTQLDRLVVGIVGIVTLVGVAFAWQATQSTGGGHMGPGGGGMQPTQPLWILIGTLIVAGVVVAIYLGMRQQITAGESTVSTDSAVATPADGEATPAVDPRPPEAEPASTEAEPEQPETDQTEETPNEKPSRRVMDLLPDDERRILQPVIDSPGLTQIELRDRAAFSKSKVSQTVTDLEKRGLLYREPQGRTYRIYPSDDLSTAESGQEG